MKEIIFAADQGPANKSGIIYAANEGRFDNSNLSEPLTNLANTASERDPVKMVLDAICPAIATPKSFSYIQPANEEEWLIDDDDSDVRAVDADFNRVKQRGTKVTRGLDNKGLTLRLDMDGEGSLPGAEERGVARLVNALFRRDLRRALNVISAAATFADKVWDGKADPDMDVADMIEAGGDARGVDANIVLVGRKARNARKRALRIQNNAGSLASAGMTNEELAAEWEVDVVKSIGNRYQTSRGATTKSVMLGMTVLSYFARFDGGITGSSNLVRWYMPVGTGGYQVYSERKPKYIEVTVEHYGLIEAPTTLGVRGLNITTAEAKG